jgi:hypothetical protein
MQSVVRLSSPHKVNLASRNFRLPGARDHKYLGTLSLLFGGGALDDESRGANRSPSQNLRGQLNTGNVVNSWWKASAAETSVSDRNQEVMGK